MNPIRSIDGVSFVRVSPILLKHVAEGFAGGELRLPRGRRWRGGLFFYANLIAAGIFSLTAPSAFAAEKNEERVQHLDKIVITGTRTPKALDQTPVRTELMLGETLERFGARNLSDALEYLPGAQVESNCQNCNTTEIRLLGLSGSYNQIAFDGQPLLSSLAGVYGVEQIPALFIDRIEVVKGGGSALYGPSAVAGIINIIPRTAYRSGGLAEYRHESVQGAPAHYASAVGDYVTADRRLAVTVFGQFARGHPVDLNADGFTELTRRRLEVAGLRVRREFGRGQLTFDYNHTHEWRRGGDQLDRAPHLAHIAEQIETWRHAASLVWTGGAETAFNYRLSLAHAQTERDSFYGGLGEVETNPAAPDYDAAAHADALAMARRQYGVTDNPLTMVDAQFNHPLGAHVVTWGVQFEREEVEDVNVDDSGTPTGKAPLTGTFTNRALFLQDDWTLSERWTLLTGVRIDDSNTLAARVVSPRLAVRFASSRYLVWRGVVSTGFRAPRVFDEDLHINTLGADPIAIVNRPGLKKESALSANVGVVWNPSAYAEKLAFEANVFGTRLRDSFQLSEIQTAADGTFFQERFNTAGASVVGFELNAAVSLSPRLRLDVGFVYQRPRSDRSETIFDDGEGRVIATRRFNKTPEQFAVVQVDWDFAPKWELAAGMRYLGRAFALNQRLGEFRGTRDFAVFDLTLNRRVMLGDTELKFQVGGRNLTDARQRDLETGAGRDATYVYGPRQPRTLFAGVRAEF